jgi:hypothetical protein
MDKVFDALLQTSLHVVVAGTSLTLGHAATLVTIHSRARKVLSPDQQPQLKIIESWPFLEREDSSGVIEKCLAANALQGLRQQPSWEAALSLFVGVPRNVCVFIVKLVGQLLRAGECLVRSRCMPFLTYSCSCHAFAPLVLVRRGEATAGLLD